MASNNIESKKNGILETWYCRSCGLFGLLRATYGPAFCGFYPDRLGFSWIFWIRRVGLYRSRLGLGQFLVIPTEDKSAGSLQLWRGFKLPHRQCPHTLITI